MVVFGTAIVLVAFHVPLLRVVARGLVVSEPIEAADDVLVIGGDRCYDVAAAAQRENPQRKLLRLYGRPGRLQRLGILPHDSEEFHRELARREVPVAAQIVFEEPPGKRQNELLQLGEWLKANPERSVVVFCDEFKSRRLKLLVARLLPGEAGRVKVHGLRDRRFGVEDWWKTRRGARSLVLSGLWLVNSAMRSDLSFVHDVDWDPDQYEAALLEGMEGSGHGEMHSQTSGWLPAVARWLDVGSVPVEAEHVVVLPGDENVRPFVAAGLVNVGLAERVLVPQNELSPRAEDGIVPPTHEIIRDVLLHRGSSEERMVFLPGTSDKTWDDALRARPFLENDADSRVAVVTSHYHTRRTRLVFRAVYGDQADRFVFVSAPTDEFSADNWWRTEAGTMAIVSEYLKLGVYWVQYAEGKYWVVCGLAGVGVLLVWRRRRRRAHRERLRVSAAGRTAAA